ncbi:MAG TPA: hypothetical protein VN616_10190 [Puia sp.]|nr:hypothetical protein [Puia sp.]
MKHRAIALLLVGLSCLSAGAQQLWVYDNTNYKAKACDLIARTPDLLLLDVHSPGEYADTTRFVSSRIGIPSCRQQQGVHPHRHPALVPVCSEGGFSGPDPF